ncbi:MAG: hypothetical protein LBV27_07315, partial [Oscillospiraceae bacterium]|nr:hypothetical protein [Oscillospiraceae bacterium]
NWDKIVRDGPDMLFENLIDMGVVKSVELSYQFIYGGRTISSFYHLVSKERLMQPAKPTLTEDEELETMYASRIGLSWMARDEDGRLRLFSAKPNKGKKGRWRGDQSYITYRGKCDFDFIRWADAEPTKLSEL